MKLALSRFAMNALCSVPCVIPDGLHSENMILSNGRTTLSKVLGSAEDIVSYAFEVLDGFLDNNCFREPSAITKWNYYADSKRSW